MRWEVKELENGKWGIFLCEKFWKFPDKPVCYGASKDEGGARQRVAWMNKSQADTEEREKEMGQVNQ